MSESRRVPIAWIEERVVLHGTRKRTMLGVCGESHRICKIATTMMTPIVVTDLYIQRGVCEEGRRCLDFDCPMNTTTRESYAQAMHPRQWKRFMKRLPATFGQTISLNRKPDGSLHDFSELFAKLPDGGVIMSRQRDR